jgi:hypothetical protein
MEGIDKKDAEKAIYLPPEMTVRRVLMEGLIAASISPEKLGPEWKEDNTWQQYDGDIWMPV